MKWIKKNISILIWIVVFFIGLSLLLYPSVSNYWNSRHQSHAIAGYTEVVEKIDKDQYEKVWSEAKEYNKKLNLKQFRWTLNEEEKKEYETFLNVGNTGVISYIEIPKIKVSLPIYHGVDEGTLQIAIGHMAGSSLPVGGESTHCVLSGHRGLPSSKLFTNLDEMERGDYFILHTLNEKLTYEVDQILTVEPEELSPLDIIEGEDLCTLVTCTPYGVNSHRLLVRGHRVSNLAADSSGVIADAVRIDSSIVALVVAIPVLVLAIVIIVYRWKRKEVQEKV